VQTTPKCNEGLRWHVFDTPATISADYVEKFQHLLSATHVRGPKGEMANFHTNNRLPQPLAGRTVYSVGSPGALSDWRTVWRVIVWP
jgi:Eukaryotic-type carbonic anhydrase